jgi:hypothetical protein
MPSETGIAEGSAAFLAVAGGGLGENRSYFRARVVQPAGAAERTRPTNVLDRGHENHAFFPLANHRTSA